MKKIILFVALILFQDAGFSQTRYQLQLDSLKQLIVLILTVLSLYYKGLWGMKKWRVKSLMKRI